MHVTCVQWDQSKTNPVKPGSSKDKENNESSQTEVKTNLNKVYVVTSQIANSVEYSCHILQGVASVHPLRSENDIRIKYKDKFSQHRE